MNRQLPYITYVLLLLSAGATSCDLINPEEPIPAYIYIEAFQLNTDPAQGSADDKITEAWVLAGSNFFGAYRLPALIPILESGPTSFTLQAGIRENGLSSTPDIYPFYQSFKIDVDLQPAQTDTFRPVIGYVPEARFAFVEDFEDIDHIFKTLITGTDSSKMVISNENVFEGKGVGLIRLSTTDPFIELATGPRYAELLNKSSIVFLEVNYQSEVPVSFGVVGYSFDQPDPVAINYVAGFNPSEEWNKIYFNLTPGVFNSGADEFQILLRASIPLTENGSFTTEQATVRIDNIKLVHF